MAKKLYYKIGEACRILDIKPFVLRYWETEFPFLKPDKSRSGQRIYSERDLEIIRRINELLNVEGYTIAGARKKLQSELDGDTLPAPPDKPAKKSAKTAAKKPSEAVKLDTQAKKKVEKLRSGIEEALREARDILDLLGEVPVEAAPKSSDSAA